MDIRRSPNDSSKVHEFYERYWRQNVMRSESGGHLISERSSRMKNAFSRLQVGSSVLDAGCGKGDFLISLLEMGFEVTGIDISPTAIAKARSVSHRARLELATLEQGLPFSSERFSAVWCTEVLEHVFNVHAALSELNRVLVPGGLIVLTVPYHGRLKNVFIALAGVERHYNPYLSRIRFFSRDSLNTCLANAGFTALSWSGVGRAWPLWKSHFVTARKRSMPLPSPEIIG